MLKYKLVEKSNPRDLTAPKKFYASHVLSGKKTLGNISRDIEDISSLSLLIFIKSIPRIFIKSVPLFQRSH